MEGTEKGGSGAVGKKDLVSAICLHKKARAVRPSCYSSPTIGANTPILVLQKIDGQEILREDQALEKLIEKGSASRKEDDRNVEFWNEKQKIFEKQSIEDRDSATDFSPIARPELLKAGAGNIIYKSPEQVMLSFDSSSNSGNTKQSSSMDSSSDSDSSSSANVEEVQRKGHKKRHHKHHDDGKQKSKKKVKGRRVVDNNHIGTLVQAYWDHFQKFSQGRKQKTKQLVPKKVWGNVYLDYMKEFPNSPFEEETLKEHLRDNVKDMKSGVNNHEGGVGATLQDTTLMKKLMETPSWKARSILKIREDAMHGNSQVTNQEGSGSVAPPRPLVATTSNDPALPKPLTKKDSLKRAGESIVEMLTEFKSMKSDRQQVVDSRSVESEARSIMAKVVLLEKQRTLDLITEVEFKLKCKEAFGI